MHAVSCWLERRCFTRAKTIIANSEKIKREIIDTYHIDPTKITVIYNGIDAEPLDRDRAKQSICQRYDLDPKVPIVLFVGSGWQRKGGDVFLNLLSKLDTPCQAIMVGKDKRLSLYQQQAKSLGIADRVIFAGLQSDVNTFYAAAEVMVFPPRYEPFSNVVLESMAQGCVVMTSGGNGAAEILPDDQVIHLSNPEASLPILTALLSDPLLRAQRQRAAIKVVNRMSMASCVKQTVDLVSQSTF